MDLEQYAVMYAAEERHWWYVGMRAIVRRVLDRELDDGRPRAILDAGCGTGKNLEFLRRYGKVTGIDYSSVALEFSRQRGERRLARASVDALPFADASFDLVTSFDVICCREVPSVERALDEFRRVLRPGGLALVRVPAFSWLRGRHDVAVHAERRLTTSELSGALRRAGLTVELASYANGFLLPVALARRATDRLSEARGDDLGMPPAPVNGALARLLSAEAPLVARGLMPVGVSAIAAGRREGQ